jgi:hypothetical protein
MKGGKTLNDDLTLLTIGESAKRLTTTSEMGLRYRIDKGEVRVVRRYGRILISEAELQRCFPREYRSPVPSA